MHVLSIRIPGRTDADELDASPERGVFSIDIQALLVSLPLPSHRRLFVSRAMQMLGVTGEDAAGVGGAEDWTSSLIAESSFAGKLNPSFTPNCHNLTRILTPGVIESFMSPKGGRLDKPEKLYFDLQEIVPLQEFDLSFTASCLREHMTACADNSPSRLEFAIRFAKLSLCTLTM